MLELPEVIILAKQANEVLTGKKIAHVFNATKVHKFTFYNRDPLEYNTLLAGKTIEFAKGYGMFVDLFLNEGTVISIGDGVSPRYGKSGEKIPDNYQILIAFEDDSFLVFTVAMYGFINVYTDGVIDNKYHELSESSISPLEDNYTKEIFLKLFTEAKKNLTAKAILATGQRIPGVGNGVLQDILYNAKIHPKRKVSTLSDLEKENLYNSLKGTLKEIILKGGRDTQKNIYGDIGGYQTILSSKTWKQPCRICGGAIIKESFMGGSIYYCPNCQK